MSMKKLFIGDSSVSSRGSVLPMWRPLFLLGLFSLLMFSAHNAQGQNMVFNATGNTSTSVNSFIDAGGSNYLMVGTSLNSSNINVPIAVKLNQNYQVIWSLQLPSTNNCVISDALYDAGSQTYWIVGTRQKAYVLDDPDTETIDESSAPRGFVWRISSNGQSSLVREYEVSDITLGSDGEDIITLRAGAFRYITPFNINGQRRYLLTGFTDRNPTTGNIPLTCNAWAVAIDGDGTVIWQNSYNSNLDPDNNSFANWASGAIFTSQGRLFISGLTRIDDNNGLSKAGIFEVNPANGALIGAAHFDDNNTTQPSIFAETAYDIVETASGELRMEGF